MVLIPKPMGNKQFFGLCAFTRSWEGLKLCQNGRPGVSRWHEGVGLGVGHGHIFGTVHGEPRVHPTLRPHQTHGIFFLGINRFDPTNFSKSQHSQITGAHNAVGAPGGGDGSGRDIAGCCKRQRQNVAI